MNIGRFNKHYLMLC